MLMKYSRELLRATVLPKVAFNSKLSQVDLTISFPVFRVNDDLKVNPYL